jgi:hypothetical protein
MPGTLGKTTSSRVPVLIELNEVMTESATIDGSPPVAGTFISGWKDEQIQAPSVESLGLEAPSVEIGRTSGSSSRR